MPLHKAIVSIAPGRLFLAMGLLLASAAQAQTDSGSTVGDLPDADVNRFEDWAVQCQQPESADSEICVMFQRQVLDNGRTILMMTVRNDPNRPEPMVMLQVPLGVLLQPGLSISVDDGEPVELDYALCNENGCITTFPLVDRIQDALKKGLAADVVIITADQQEVVVSVSLKGFTAALEAL